MKRRLARTGPWLSVAVSAFGVAAAFPVALSTPPLSGGTLAALLMVAVFGSIALRVVHIAERRRERLAADAGRPGAWYRINAELAQGVSTDDLRKMLAGLDGVLQAGGVR